MPKSTVDDTNVSVQNGLSRELVQAISDNLDEPDYMRDFRMDAYEIFSELPVPSAANSEEWRRTDVTDLDFSELIFSDAGVRRTESGTRYFDEIQQAESDRKGLFLSNNTLDFKSELDSDLEADGVVLTSLHRAVRNYPDIVKKHFMTEGLEVDSNKFSALHAAFWTGGALLYVPNNTEVEGPIEIHNYVDHNGLSVSDHLLVVVGANSSVNIVDSHRSKYDNSTRALSTSVTEIHVGDGSKVDYSHIQDLGKNYYDISMRRGVCDNNASLNWITGTIGAQKNKTNAITKLNGEGSETYLYGVMLATDDQHVDSDISTIHDAPYTTNEMLARGVVMEESKGIFRGVIDMKNGSRKAKGSLHERALMVGNGAEADAVPEMEVDENDVKAAHSASVGELDQKQLLYMQSRGISQEKARRLIILGFFEPIFEKLPVERVKKNIVELIHRKLDEANV